MLTAYHFAVIAHCCKLRKANAVDELGCSFKVVRMVHKEQHLLRSNLQKEIEIYGECLKKYKESITKDWVGLKLPVVEGKGYKDS